MDASDAQVKMPPLLGGRTSLDFPNTVEGRDGKRADERLGDYADLVRWSSHAGVISDQQALMLLDVAAGKPSVAREVFEPALTFRESLYRVFVAIAHDREPDTSSLELLGRQYERAIARGQLAVCDDNGTFIWTWSDDIRHLDRPLWPIALDAVDLLRSDQLSRVKQCANVEGCGWLFLDTSKNGSRRWCSMAACGSRIKMRRQYAKRRAAASS